MAKDPIPSENKKVKRQHKDAAIKRWLRKGCGPINTDRVQNCDH